MSRYVIPEEQMKANFSSITYNGSCAKVFSCSGKITPEFIKKNGIKPGDIIAIPNTRNQEIEQLSKIDDGIKIRIIGALDETKSLRFRAYKYVQRTIYSVSDVLRIIESFEKLEKGINQDWPDWKKAAFMYKQLAEQVKFSEETGHVTSRNLLTIANKSGVCAGLSLTYQEAMDRLGIKCRYRNKSGEHCWNELCINGIYYPVDVTHDCHFVSSNENDKKGQCRFLFFMSDKDFYKYKAHQADDGLPMVANVFDRNQNKTNSNDGHENR